MSIGTSSAVPSARSSSSSDLFFNRDFSKPAQEKLLIIFFDWPLYTRIAKEMKSEEVFAALNEFYAMSDLFFSSRGGRVLKYMGDAGLVIFPCERAEAGIVSLLEFKEQSDIWLGQKGFAPGIKVNAHFGEVTIGAMGAPGFARLDIIGSSVNICATLGKRGLTLSPQAFRALSPKNRKHFKKFTPPVVYTAIND
jgi:class 3 adenylate cyclase